jgi:hypothetical protein
MITSNTPHDIDSIRELTAAIALGRQLATTARADLTAATPVLIDALRNKSGQSRKIEKILWSLWNDEHPISLCDNLAGLDTKLAQAVIGMISARAHLGGDADDLLRQIIDQSGSQPPTV